MYYRIKKNNEFQKMFARGKKSFSPSLLMMYMPSDKVRLGLCVSKKHGKSVMRNRIKRLLREAFRSTCEQLKTPFAIVLVPKKADVYSLENFKKSLEIMFKKEGIKK